MGRNSAKTPIKCTFLGVFLPYTRSWGKPPFLGLKWPFFGPFWPPGAPQGGDPPPRPGLEAPKTPPRRGGALPRTPRGGVEIWPASPFFIGNLQGPGWQTKGTPLDCHFLALFDPPRGGSPPSGTPPGGGPPPRRPPRAPQIHPPGGLDPPPPKGPFGPLSNPPWQDFQAFDRKIFPRVPRFSRHFDRE